MTASNTIDTQAARNLIGRVKARHCEPGGSNDAYQLAVLAEKMVRQFGLARDALRRAGCPVDTVGDDLAALIDQYNADSRGAVLSLAEECARLRARAVPAVGASSLAPVDLSMLIGRHTPVEPDPCRVCGAEMTPTSIGGGIGTTYRCSVAAANYFNPTNRAENEDHYRRSEQRITYHGDSRIVAALHELRERRQAAGEDMTVPVGAYAFPNGHGKGLCYYRLRHEGGDRWVVDHDFTYSHDPAHATLEVD